MARTSRNSNTRTNTSTRKRPSRTSNVGPST
jgi:hypothetical protein